MSEEKEKKPSNPFAFPLTDGSSFATDGMTLRDYFAAKVLEGTYSNNEMYFSMKMDKKNCTRDKLNDTREDYIAQQCYKMADAMLKEREKQ